MPATVGQIERKTQQRVVKLFHERLGYRERLKEQIPALISKWEKIIGVKVGDWQVDSTGRN